VDVVVDDVGGRGRHIHRWIAVNRNRHENRDRQNEKPKRRRRRCQHDEIGRRRREEIYRRWWRRGEPVVGIVERKQRLAEINHFFFHRRWYVVSDGVESWWRFKRCGEIG
jgi:hypothetical protein